MVYEYSEERETDRRFILNSSMSPQEKEHAIRSINPKYYADNGSTQTFDEFYGPKDGKIFAGDCEDFAAALTTVYHIALEYANDRAADDRFYEELADGLEHYRILTIETPHHALNIAATITDKVTFDVIEPQVYDTIGGLAFKPEAVFISIESESDKQMINIHNKDFSAISNPVDGATE